VALRKVASLPGTDGASDLPESSWYSVKRRLLGPPLASEQLRVQAGAISILFTGGNTSFSGFPFLTSFVAEDAFLPAGCPSAATGWSSPTGSSC
jgi:hypothetical protein